MRDVGRFRQILLNLVSNAIDAAPHGAGGLVNVRTRFDTIEKRVLISVTDNGPGVPEELREKIFQPFFSTKPRGEYSIRVCLGTACYVRGGIEIVKRLSQTLGVGVGETTPDGKFTLEVMRCIGACGLAPALLVNDKVVRQVNPDKLNRVLALCE